MQNSKTFIGKFLGALCTRQIVFFCPIGAY